MGDLHRRWMILSVATSVQDGFASEILLNLGAHRLACASERPWRASELHGVAWPMTVDGVEYLNVSGARVQVDHEKDPAAMGWGAVDADYVRESTGVFAQ